MSDWAAGDQISALTSRFASLTAGLPVSRLRRLSLLAILFWFLWLLADLVWLVVPHQAPTAVPMAIQSRSAAGSAGNKPSVDVKQMQAWHLFGEANQEVVVEEKPVAVQPTDADLNAKETRLQLTLLGVMQSSVPESSFALIQHSNKAELYKVGDKLPGGRDVSLSRVLADRVIIDNRGSFESLFLYDEKNKPAVTVNRRQPKAAASRSKMIDHRSDKSITQLASNYRKQLLSDPMSLADVIKISIAKDSSGQIMGYRVRPGRHRKEFNQLGLKSGDIVTQVNGVDMNDPSKAMELYGQLREAKEASFVVKRGNEEVNLLLNLTE